jgi:hypothetical protein
MTNDLIALLDPQEREFLAQQTTAENPTDPTDVQDPTDPTDQPDPTDLQEPTPEAEPEQKAQPEEEDDIAENDPRAIAKMLKRINKLTARAKTAEETSAKAVSDAVAEREARIAELEAKLTQTTPASPAEAPVPTSAETPLAHVENAAQLQEEIARAKRIRAWAITHWDGVDPETGDPVEVPDGNGGTRVATAAEIRSHFSRCDEVLNEHAPARAEFLRQRTEQIELARTEYPALFDTKSDEHRLFQQVLQALPEIRRFADPEVFVGEWLEGHRARMQRGETPKPTPIKQPERAPAAPVTKTPVPKVATDKLVRTKALEEVFQSGGSADAIERFFLATASRA